MKKLTPILGIVALSALTGHAQSVFQYNTGDLILDFSRTGFPDLEVDIGSLSSLQSQAAADGGTVQLNSYDVPSQLLNDFGNVNGLSFTVVGALYAQGTTDNVAWVTQKQTGATPNSPPNDLPNSATQTLAGDILAVANGITTWSSQNPASASGNTANVASIPSSASLGAAYIDSYTYHSSGITGSIHNSANTTPTTFTSGYIVSDLFQFSEQGNTTPSVYEGDFTFNSDGTLDFTSAVVAAPEPATYGVLAAGGILALSLRRQLRKQNI